MTEKRKEEIKLNSRKYYWEHRDELVEKSRALAEQAAKSKKLNRSWEVMLEEWKNGLQKRLQDNDIPEWLRFGIIKQIEMIDEKERTLQKDR